MAKLRNNIQKDIFIYEFIDDLPYLIKKMQINKDLLIISTNFRTSYQLRKSQIKFIKLDDFYYHKESYQSIIQKTLKIPKLLGKNFFKIYKNFRLHEWNIFDDYFYRFKTLFDQTYYYTFCLNEILNKYRPETIFIRSNNKIEFTKQLSTDSEQSILCLLLKSNKKKIKIKTFIKHPSIVPGNRKINYFDNIKNKMKYLFEKLYMKSKINNIEPKIISLYCSEISSLIYLDSSLRKKIINLKYPYNISNDVNSKKQSSKLIEELKKDSLINEVFLINGFDTGVLFYSLISEVLPSLKNIYEEFEFFNNLINNDNTKLIIFSTLTPFCHQNIIFNKICDLKQIKKVVWCHGGYYNFNLGGFEVSDFRSCKNHLGYGDYIKELTKSKNFLPAKTFKKKYNSFAVGSPNINLLYNSKNNKTLEKKSIIFVRGNYSQYNNIYFPLQRNDTLNSSYDLHAEVLNLLKGFQFDYEIVFKGYPHFDEETHFWKKYLNDNGMDNIKFIGKEKTLDQLYKDNQLVIIPWLSTTFYQALPYKNKIFVLDVTTSLGNYFKRNTNEINHFNNKEKFLSALKKMLPNLNTIKFNSNKNAKKFFLNNNKIKNIKKDFNSAVNEIIHNDYA